MIDFFNSFTEKSDMCALWCMGDLETVELAKQADFALTNKIKIISALPQDIKTMWPWLEKTKVKLLGRFYLEKKITEKAVSDLTEQMNACFKQGGDGVQVILRKQDLALFASELHLIRDDLFFNKTLSVGLDLSSVLPTDWSGIFKALRQLKVDSLLLILPKDTGDKSDFVGRLFGVLDLWNPDFRGDLHFVLGNTSVRVEQVVRLVQRMKPDLMKGLKFFVNI